MCRQLSIAATVRRTTQAVGEDESLRIAAENEEKNFQEGFCCTQKSLLFMYSNAVE